MHLALQKINLADMEGNLHRESLEVRLSSEKKKRF